jgi:hypothetical protein
MLTGREVVERYLIKGMAQGVLLATGASDSFGQTGRSCFVNGEDRRGLGFWPIAKMWK